MGADPRGPHHLGGWPPHSLLGGLTSQTRERLLRLGGVQTFGSGETVLIEHDRATREVYVVLDGSLKVVSNTDSGTAVLLAIRAKGDLVGELACLDGSPRLASVITIRPCELRRIGQDSFLAFLRAHPEVSLAVSRSVSAKLRNSTWHRVEYGGSPVPVRLARLLIQLATQYGDDGPEGTAIRLSLTQSDLAALIGASDTAVHKALGRLRRDGVIATEYRRIVIRDWAALRSAAGITEIPPEYGGREPGTFRW